MIRTPKGHVAQKTLLVTIGSALITAAPFVPGPAWLPGAMFVLGGLLGGKALLKRPGDVRPNAGMRGAGFTTPEGK